ncbi:MAG: glycosyl transferase [Azospira oryzae]|nr:MAG: glycosyl transferase [Azospira oryzae]
MHVHTYPRFITSMSKKTVILLAIILLKFWLQYILVSPEYDLHRDEYLHLDQADHLAWGYLSVPPVSSWIAFIIQALGNGVFWVKFFPALFGALTILVVWKTIEELNGNLAALTLGALCVLFSALLRLNILFQPNSLDVLCWTALCFTLIKYFNTENKTWLYASAVVFGIGFLNKYNIAFLLIGIVPALLLTEQRKVLLKKDIYLAMLVALVIVLPNLIWQYTNHFPVLHHMKLLAETQLVNVNRGDFLKSQLLFFTGALIVIVAGWVALLLYAPFRKYRFFFWSFVFTLAVFTYLKAKDYYAVGLYPIYIAFGAVYLGELLRAGRRRYVLAVVMAMPALLFIPIYQIAFPNKSPQYIYEHPEPYQKLGLLRWEDGKDHSLPQDFADMLGWKELAEKVDKVCEQLPKGERIFILCDNYGQTGAINYYSKNKELKAVSFNADYINWFDLDTKIVHLIRVKEQEDRHGEMETTRPYFEKAFIADSIADPLAREYGTTIFVFSNPTIDVNALLKKEIEEERWFK